MQDSPDLLTQPATTVVSSSLIFYTTHVEFMVNSREQPSLAVVEKELIANALKHSRGNKTAAAKVLGVDRRTLYRKCREYSINVTKEVTTRGGQ